MINKFILFFLFIPAIIRAQDSYQEKVTSACNMGLTIANNGLTGNCFKGNFLLNNAPSCQYPKSSGVEHLFEGGLWVGAMVNGQTIVTTGAVDDASGYSTGKAGFDFTCGVGSQLTERSSLVSSPLYSTSAISNQDFVSDFTDTNLFVPGTKIPIQNYTTPLGIKVHFESYNWNYSFANNFVILNYTIVNAGKNTLDSVYAGYWFDGVVRNINITPPGGSAFFNKGGNGFIDSLHLAYCFDALGDTAFTRSYFGFKFLGSQDKYGFHSPGFDSTKVYFNVWQFNTSTDPIYFSPSTAAQKYNKLAVGLNTVTGLDFNNTILPTIKQYGNRATLLSAGPYKSLKPGDSLNIVFAVICAKMTEDGHSVQTDDLIQKTQLIGGAQWAQRTYNGQTINGILKRYILPTPPDIPNAKIIAGDHKIDIFWTKNSENSVNALTGKKDFEGYRIYKSKFGFDVQAGSSDVLENLQLVAQYDRNDDSLFFNTGFDSIRLNKPVKFEGDTALYFYKYTIENVENGWQTAVGITAFDQGNVKDSLPSMESAISPTLKRVYSGTVPNNNIASIAPYVYPNPYYAGAEWEGNRQFEEDRKIIFANLPLHCIIKVYTPGGDLIKIIQHNKNYSGSDIKWFQTYSDPQNTVFSGGEHAWDLLSDAGQIIARGLYIYYIQDLDSGKENEGKFIIIK